MSRRPLPENENLDEIAAKYRMTPDKLLFAWEVGPGYRQKATLEETAQEERRSMDAIRECARMYAERVVREEQALAVEFGISAYDIRQEYRSGGWENARMAAEHLAQQPKATYRRLVPDLVKIGDISAGEEQTAPAWSVVLGLGTAFIIGIGLLLAYLFLVV